VQTSIEKVISTLAEAILLVVIVVVIFLQTWRASLIPLLTISRYRSRITARVLRQAATVKASSG
jgi:Cu/Ag efflux pump CusA